MPADATVVKVELEDIVTTKNICYFEKGWKQGYLGLVHLKSLVLAL